jgi:Acetyltransferase (GNAT) domain
VGGDRQADRRWLGQIGLNELPSWPGPYKVEVGWELDPSVWGRGLATEGGRAALRYGFEVVGLERIISVARADNVASRRVMEKCGLVFQEEVTHRGAWSCGMPSTGPAGRPASRLSEPTNSRISDHTGSARSRAYSTPSCQRPPSKAGPRMTPSRRNPMRSSAFCSAMFSALVIA